ncbi:nucleotidyltransferase [Alkalithermobacter paradoxus]|uniref:tRNA(Met) cytidine acetate ligase n=1 Tax=Alkalithermobacter paradoxus TaxID=29349 RepID=A0A1V4IAL3_9FIRM|nr:hypothetical protein CLOTH_02060 [[Clostridium] thermoalcaliphilum]
MKVLGVIVEYNPFHNGHLHHLLESKKATNSTHTIAVMSGHFLQRGEPALFDKWSRAKMAVNSGVDLVIELPTIFSSQSAEFFAHGSICALESTNVVDSVCFGSEIGNIDILYKISEILINEPPEFKSELKSHIANGDLFPVARSRALFSYINNNKLISISEGELLHILNSPNNILGIEYIKSILSLKSNIKPYTIQRIKAHYNSKEIESEICSATAIRESLRKSIDLNTLSKVVPSGTYDCVCKRLDDGFFPVFDDLFYEIITSTIIREGSSINSYFEVNEGLENKILDLVLRSNSFYDLLTSIKSKRYTMTKIKRILMNILLGITKEDVFSLKNQNSIPYVRILAFNDKGREIIKEMKKKSESVLINKLSNANLNNPNISKFLKYDIRSTDLYNVIYYKNNKNILKGSMDYYISPIYVK